MQSMFSVIPTIGSVVFGIIAMIILLDVQFRQLTHSKRIMFAGTLLLVVIVNIVVLLLLGMKEHARFYMLLVHLPLAVIFFYITRIQFIKIVFTLFTAVFLIFPANIANNLIAHYISAEPIVLVMCYVVALVCELFLIEKFLRTDFNYLIKQYSSHNFIKLFVLPVVYSVCTFLIGRYDYSITTPVYSLVFRSILFFITFIAYLLVLDIARTDFEKQTMKNTQMLLSLQLQSANNQKALLLATQEQTVVYRHDMRHHLSLIHGFLSENNTAAAIEYLNKVQADIDSITPVNYCNNDTVNLILSYFASKAQEAGVNLSMEVELPKDLTISETEVCTILSNGLENAVTAASDNPNKTGDISFTCTVNENRLLIYIANTYTNMVHFENGLPVSSREGHGFGVKSIASIAQKHNGYYSFEIENGMFILRVVLPLEI